jgi:hypothetical protein
METEPIAMAFFLHPSLRHSVCVSIMSLQGNGSVNCIPLFRIMQRLDKHILAANNKRYNIRIVGRVIFYAVRAVWKETTWLILPRSYRFSRAAWLNGVSSTYHVEYYIFFIINLINLQIMLRPPLWSSAEFLATDPEARVRFPALPDYLRSGGSVMGSTQPRQYNWGATWKKK